MLGLGACIVSGGTFVTRRKFSVQNFSNDCIQCNATIFQYIGELCRYLVAAPISTSDAVLRNNGGIRYAYGNGLRSDVWLAFQNRYNVGLIVEFYAATEGNTVLMNSTGQLGALGWVPRLFDFLYPVCILKVHTEEG